MCIRTITFRFLMLFVLLFSGLASNDPAYAQEGIKLRSLEISFWPEYDHPSMLVIYRAELDPSVRLPIDLKFRIPAYVGAPHAIAAGQSNDSLFNVTAERQVDGEWAWITFNIATPVIRLEYYDDTLNQQNTERSFSYTWKGDFAVDRLHLEVQQPVDATNMVLSPSFGTSVIGTDGLFYYDADFGALNQGQEFSFSLRYEKTTNTLSLTGFDLQAGVPASTDIPGRITMLSVLPWILGTLGAVLIIGGVFWYWRSGQAKSPEPVATSRGYRKSASVIPDTSTGSKRIYCHQCGRLAAQGDKFCRICGARLRVE